MARGLWMDGWRVRWLVETHHWIDADEPVVIPPGTLGTIHYVDNDNRELCIITDDDFYAEFVEFDQVELVRD